MGEVKITTVVENIYTIAQEKEIKIGDLEREVGVSAGYLSRFLKPSGAIIKMAADVLFKICDCLKVSVEDLLYYNSDDRTPPQKKMDSFLKKLARDTENYKITWKKYVNKNLFTSYMGNKYKSPFFDETYMKGATHNWEADFTCVLDDNTVLYLISVHYEIDPDKHFMKITPGYELYANIDKDKFIKLCYADNAVNPTYFQKLLRLVKDAKSASEKSNFDAGAENIIDNYLSPKVIDGGTF